MAPCTSTATTKSAIVATKKAEKQKLIDKEKTRAPQGTPTRRVGQ